MTDIVSRKGVKTRREDEGQRTETVLIDYYAESPAGARN